MVKGNPRRRPKMD